jgi:Ca-activated chloride channel family protein
MDLTQDLYSILGVLPTASPDELRQAFRSVARYFHPDRNKAAGADVLFKEINAAYEVLSDSKQRAEYDTLRRDQDTTPRLEADIHLWRRRLVRMDEPQMLHALLTIKPSVMSSVGSHSPLNLCLVVDRSNSMSGERLGHVKGAAHQIIDNANDDDIISVVSFSDKAEVIVPATHPDDRRTMKATVSTIRAGGATEIFAGLEVGVQQIMRYRAPRYVNHIILITDGRTYGDEEKCMNLADEARDEGIGISGMGIGEDWNDHFVDALATRTGGSSTYASSPSTIRRFLEDRIRTLVTAYAERAKLVVAPAPEVHLNVIYRLSPNPIELDGMSQPIPMGTIDAAIPTSFLCEFHVNTWERELGDLFVGRIDITGDILDENRAEKILTDLTVTVEPEQAEEDPPPQLLDAISRVTLYRLQQRARDALDQEDAAEATRKLEYLATRLFEVGEEELGKAALLEARRVAQTRMFSEEGAKQLKYGTRAFLLPPGTTIMGEDE